MKKKNPLLILSNTNILCLLIAFTSFILMLIFADNASLWIDDLFTISLVKKGQSLSTLIELVLKDAYSNAPLFYVFAYIWMRIVPYGTLWLKLLSILFVTVGIFLCGQNAKALKGERAAVIATLFVGTSSFLIRHAAYNFRCYGFLFFLVNLLIKYYIKRTASIGNERIPDILKYSIVMTMLLYTHYYGIIVVGAFFLGDLYLYIRKKIKWQCVISYITAGILFVPWLFHAAKLIIGRNGEFWASPPSIEVLHSLVINIFNENRLMFSFLIFAVLVCVIKIKYTRYIYIEKRNKFLILLLAFVCAFVIGTTYIYSRYIHPSGSMFVTRYFIIIVPMLMIVSAIGLDFLLDFLFLERSKKYIQKVFLVIFVICVFSLGGEVFNKVRYVPYTVYEPYEQAIEWIYDQQEAHAEDSLTITNYNVSGFEYYVTHNGNRPKLPNIKTSFNFASDGDVSYGRIYRFDGHDGLPQEAEELLKQHYILIDENENPNVFVYKRIKQ